LQGPIRRATGDPAERLEMRGLMGRVNKQIYVDARGRPSDQARQALRQAIACYLEVYEEDPQNRLWHGVNLIALTHRARSDGIAIRGLPDSRAVASAIIEAVRNPRGRTVEAWDYTCAAEACIALDDWDAATHWIERYIQDQSTDRFALAGTLRQLTEVWRFTAETPEAGQLVVALRGALLRSRDGRLELTPAQLHRTSAALDSPGPRLERVLGTAGPQTLTWLRTGMERARSVALIRGPGGRGIGTGFLVHGGDLHPALGEELVVVTNAHVVSELQDDGGVEPEQAMITFEAQTGIASTQTLYRVSKLLWGSPKQHLDTSLLRLEPKVQAIAPCPIAKRLPAPNNDERVYVIGHPRGGEISFSLQDNELLDHEGPPAGTPSKPERTMPHPLSRADGAWQFREPGIQSGAGLASNRTASRRWRICAPPQRPLRNLRRQRSNLDPIYRQSDGGHFQLVIRRHAGNSQGCKKGGQSHTLRRRGSFKGGKAMNAVT
jgi:Trypsin-like peptidase domain